MSYDHIRRYFGQRKSDITKISALLSKTQRKHYQQFVVWMGFNSFLEMFTLASLIPLIQFILRPEIFVQDNFFSIKPIEIFTQFQRTLILSVIVTVLFIVKNYAGYRMYARSNNFVFALAAELSEKKLREYFSLDYLAQQKTNSSVLLREIAYAPIEFSQHIILGSMTLLSELMVIILFTGLLAMYHIVVFFSTLIIIIPLIAVVRRISTARLQELKETVQHTHNENLVSLGGALQSFIEAKVFHVEKYFIDHHNNLQTRVNRQLALLNTSNALPAKLSEIFLVGGILFVISIVSFFDAGATSSFIALLVLIVLYAYRVIPSLNKILILWSHIRTYEYTIDILQPMVSYENPKNKKTNVQEFHRSLEIKDCSFGYPERKNELFRNASMKIEKGKITGIIGKTGSGKTSLLLLTMGILKPTNGTLFLDDIPEKGINDDSWRTLFAFVPQHPFILNASIQENVAFGIPFQNIDSRKVTDALQAVGLDDFIASLPEGILTIIGENGKQISGGQQQRIAIARALYRNTPVIVFDEPTSGLDRKSEQEFVNLLGNLKKQKKTIVIASHRQSTLIRCNVLYEVTRRTIIRRRKK